MGQLIPEYTNTSIKVRNWPHSDNLPYIFFVIDNTRFWFDSSIFRQFFLFTSADDCTFILSNGTDNIECSNKKDSFNIIYKFFSVLLTREDAKKLHKLIIQDFLDNDYNIISTKYLYKTINGINLLVKETTFEHIEY